MSSLKKYFPPRFFTAIYFECCLCAFLWAPLTDSAQAAEITSFTQTFDYGASPGTDIFDINGTFSLGAGESLNLPAGEIILSFDGGRYQRIFPANSFTTIAGGYRYQSTTDSIRLFRILSNGSFTITGRALDLSGTNSTNLQQFSFSVDGLAFATTPNSIPVARISGPTTAVAGENVSLSGALSSDANNQTLTFAWSLISKPQGSNAVLSSTSGSSVNLSTDKNGYYAVKLQVNDGISDGVAKVFTFRAIGAAEDPLPPLGSSNGFIQLFADKASYFIGESAVVSMQTLTNLGNGTDEYYFEPTLGTLPFTFSLVTAGNYSYTSAPFSSAGQQLVNVNLYIQNKDLARQLNSSILFFQNEIAAINAALANESDPQTIASGQAKIAEYQLEITKAQSGLQRLRTPIGRAAQLLLNIVE